MALDETGEAVVRPDLQHVSGLTFITGSTPPKVHA